jgi:hypothetical protein
MRQVPVAIVTTRDGQPYVLFGTHYDEAGEYFVYHVEDGPHIAAWESLLRRMEEEGVHMTRDLRQ